METPIEMLYPTFKIHREKGIFPDIHLPVDYKKLIVHFYELRGRLDVEAYARKLEEIFKHKMPGLEIRLNWDNRKGLTNISTGVHSGLDLSYDSGFPHFQEHNLGMNYSFIAGAIAMKYVSELLKSR